MKLLIKNFKSRFLAAWVLGTFGITMISPVPLRAEAPPRFFASLPQALGSLKEIRENGPSSAPWILYLEDAHASPEAQENIRKILAWLHDQWKARGEAQGFKRFIIGLEGASGPIHAEYLDLFPEHPQINESTLQELTQKGELSGAELFAWDLSRKRVKEPSTVFQGIEDPDLYRENLKLYRELLFHEEEIQSLLKPVLEKLEREKTKILSPELRRFLQERERRKWGEYGRPETSPQLLSYIKFLAREAYRVLEIDLEHPVEKLRFPNLIDLLASSSSFDPDQLFAEMTQLEEGILAKSVRTPAEKDLLERAELMRLLKKLLALELNESEHRKILHLHPVIPAKAGIHGFPTTKVATIVVKTFGNDIEKIDSWIMKALRFYELARQRDQAFLDRGLQHHQPGDLLVLVAGGFHTEGIQREMMSRNLNFAVIRPNILGETDPRLYHRVLRDENTGLLDEFRGADLSKQEALFLQSILNAGRENGNLGLDNIIQAVNRHPVLGARFRALAQNNAGRRRLVIEPRAVAEEVSLPGQVTFSQSTLSEARMTLEPREYRILRHAERSEASQKPRFFSRLWRDQNDGNSGSVLIFEWTSSRSGWLAQPVRLRSEARTWWGSHSAIGRESSSGDKNRAKPIQLDNLQLRFPSDITVKNQIYEKRKKGFLSNWVFAHITLNRKSKDVETPVALEIWWDPQHQVARIGDAFYRVSRKQLDLTNLPRIGNSALHRFLSPQPTVKELGEIAAQELQPARLASLIPEKADSLDSIPLETFKYLYVDDPGSNEKIRAAQIPLPEAKEMQINLQTARAYLFAIANSEAAKVLEIPETRFYFLHALITLFNDGNDQDHLDIVRLLKRLKNLGPNDLSSFLGAWGNFAWKVKRKDGFQDKKKKVPFYNGEFPDIEDDQLPEATPSLDPRSVSVLILLEAPSVRERGFPLQPRLRDHFVKEPECYLAFYGYWLKGILNQWLSHYQSKEEPFEQTAKTIRALDEAIQQANRYHPLHTSIKNLPKILEKEKRGLKDVEKESEKGKSERNRVAKAARFIGLFISGRRPSKEKIMSYETTTTLLEGEPRSELRNQIGGRPFPRILSTREFILKVRQERLPLFLGIRSEVRSVLINQSRMGELRKAQAAETPLDLARIVTPKDLANEDNLSLLAAWSLIRGQDKLHLIVPRPQVDSRPFSAEGILRKIDAIRNQLLERGSRRPKDVSGDLGIQIVEIDSGDLKTALRLVDRLIGGKNRKRKAAFISNDFNFLNGGQLAGRNYFRVFADTPIGLGKEVMMVGTRLRDRLQDRSQILVLGREMRRLGVGSLAYLGRLVSAIRQVTQAA